MKHGRTLLQKGPRAFPLVISGEGSRHVLSLDLQPRGQIPLHLPDRIFGEREGNWGETSDSFRNCVSLGREVRDGNDSVHQSGTLCFGSVDDATGEDQLPRSTQAYQQWETLRTAPAGDTAQSDFRLAEERGVGGDPDVAGHRQF
jgi:hypothetical protein